MIEFSPFPKIGRWSREVVVTEKLDGTNASIFIGDDGQFFMASRNRWITQDDDNYGFAKWALTNKADLLTMGPGHHFGEWWGQGIQRKYGLDEKRFSLFNVHKWKDVRPACCHVVPELFRGLMDEFYANKIMDALERSGSIAAPGFRKPEGIVIFCTHNSALFKKTFEKDQEGKSA